MTNNEQRSGADISAHDTEGSRTADVLPAWEVMICVYSPDSEVGEAHEVDVMAKDAEQAKEKAVAKLQNTFPNVDIRRKDIIELTGPYS